MPSLNRRSFLKQAAAWVGAGMVARLPSSAWSRPVGANAAIRVAVIGVNDKGKSLVLHLLDLPGVRIAAVCDVDPAILARQIAVLRSRQVAALATTDARELLARDDIDALVIATDNHWHALLTVWGCQSGKDVYVEKPVSHTVWEGRKMVEAAAKYRRIVQSGLQRRSDIGLPGAVQYVRDGHMGKVLWTRALCYARREGIGRKLPWYPEGMNYDLYCGPSPVVPLERDQLHFAWHMMWATGNGELPGNAVHMLDIARRFSPIYDAPPRRVLSFGQRYVNDAGQTPDCQAAVYDYPGAPMYYEARALPAKPGVRYLDQYRGLRTGTVVQCEGGYFAGLNGGAFYDNRGKRIRTFPGDDGGNHLANFFAAMRSRRPADLTAPIEVGHASTAISHQANISYRVGAPADPAEIRSALEAFPLAGEFLEGLRGHLATHHIDIARRRLTLGRWLELDATGDGIRAVGADDPATLARARFLLKETQRPPYVIPEQV